MPTELTWLGHAAFRLDTPSGLRIYIDPFLTGNPTCPDTERAPQRADIIAVTHGHADHVGDTVALAREHGSIVIAPFELSSWLGANGVPHEQLRNPNKGGTVDVAEVSFTLTNAFHSSSAPDGTYTGEATGLIISIEAGATAYFAGDTCVFGDMQLIGRIHNPSLAILPIGDHYTMGPRDAAVALELLGVKRCLPCHWGTFPALTGTPDQLRALAPDVVIEDIRPGQTTIL